MRIRPRIEILSYGSRRRSPELFNAGCSLSRISPQPMNPPISMPSSARLWPRLKYHCQLGNISPSVNITGQPA